MFPIVLRLASVRLSTREAFVGYPGIVSMRAGFGGTRIVDMLVGEQLPRIC